MPIILFATRRRICPARYAVCLVNLYLIPAGFSGQNCSLHGVFVVKKAQAGHRGRRQAFGKQRESGKAPSDRHICNRGLLEAVVSK
jgi:hypothetical protein